MYGHLLKENGARSEDVRLPRLVPVLFVVIIGCGSLKGFQFLLSLFPSRGKRVAFYHQLEIMVGPVAVVKTQISIGGLEKCVRNLCSLWITVDKLLECLDGLWNSPRE